MRSVPREAKAGSGLVCGHGLASITSETTLNRNPSASNWMAGVFDFDHAESCERSESEEYESGEVRRRNGWKPGEEERCGSIVWS